MRPSTNLIIVSLLLAVWIIPGCNQDKETYPNIIYILADDMGFGDVSCLNPDSKISTPNLDRLAQEGITFTDAHSGSAVCTPTRYGILTGRYCWRSPLKSSVLWPWDGPLIEADRLTVGGFLKQHGYTTACIGKWHLGWDWSTLDGSGMNEEIPLGKWDPAIRNLMAEKIDFSAEIKNGPVTRGFDYYFGDDVPNFPPYCFIENNRTIGLPSINKSDTMYGNPGPMVEGWKLSAVMPALTRKAADFQGTSNAGTYGDFVQEVDWTVGQVMKALEEAELAENTLLIITSDNGSPGRDGTDMGGPTGSVRAYGHNPSHIFRGIKADIWEGGHHVPFFARWPGKIIPGSESDEIICHTDLLATCAAILNKSLPDNAGEDSYNILPALLGEHYDKPIREATVHHSIDGSFAIRQGKWKLELCGGSGGWSQPGNNLAKEIGLPEIQLYDLSTDPKEENNLQEQYPGVVEDLSSLLQKYMEEGRSTPY